MNWWNRRGRWAKIGIVIGVIFITLIVIGILAPEPESDAGVTSARSARQSVPAPAPTTATPIPAPPTPTPEPVVMEFEGRGDKVVGPFHLPEGVVRYVASHSGSRNFVVKFIGQNDELSINTIGRYVGARAHQVENGNLIGLVPGEHRLQVEADGNWTLKLTLENPSSGVAPPLDTSDSGDQVITWILLKEGIYTLSAKHNGSRNFVVYLLAANGRHSELLVNDIGSYDGQKIIKVEKGLLGLSPPPGLYALTIEADGDWGVSIE